MLIIAVFGKISTFAPELKCEASIAEVRNANRAFDRELENFLHNSKKEPEIELVCVSIVTDGCKIS